jgi:hypothetical protein
MALALSRFGTFSNLTTMYSAEDNIPTLSFHGSTYTSEYIEFDGKEEVDQQNKPLDKLNAQEAHLFQTLGVAPGQTNPGYPFIDFGGKWRQLGTIYDPSILSGMAPEAVANAMGDPSTRAGKSIQASADVYTAIICGLDGDKPANVCSAPSVTAAKAALNGSGK